MKRLFDLTVALTLLSITAPLLVVIAALVAFELHKAPIYVSKRVGRDGRLFGLFRFRTMTRIYRPDDPLETHQLSRVGAVIRNYSLDDLPNLLNVLIGDLSIIGPRPMEAERVDPLDPHWRRILSVRPGCVGLAVLSLARTYNESDPRTKQQMELEYVERQSLLFDLKLFAQAWRDHFRSSGNIKARGEPHASPQ